MTAGRATAALRAPGSTGSGAFSRKKDEIHTGERLLTANTPLLQGRVFLKEGPQYLVQERALSVVSSFISPTNIINIMRRYWHIRRLDTIYSA